MFHGQQGAHGYDINVTFADQVKRAIVQSVVQVNENLKASPSLTALFKMGAVTVPFIPLDANLSSPCRC